MSTTRVPVSSTPSPDSPRTLGRLLARQREAFLRDGPPSYEARREDLRKLRTAVLAHRREIADALTADFGHRSRYETEILELLTLVWGIEYLEKHLRRFMRPERRRVAMPMRMAKARIEFQPLGVIGIIAPWNYPVSLALMPLATALASGNRAMVKPSEVTPHTSRLLAQLLRENFDEDRVSVVTGDASVGAAFSALPFDKVVFTGSTNVGRAVARAASDNLVPVMLELGGKSPAIVDEGQPLQRVAENIAFGKLANAGQTCIAPDYVLLHERDVEPFVAAYRQAVATMYPAGPTSDDYSSIVSERHHERLRGLLDDARAKGARVLEVGEVPATARSRQRTLPPMVVLDTTDRMRVLREEIFGPILPVVTYKTLDEAIAYVNARPRPLALYYFGGKGPNRTKVLTRTTSGNVTINGTLLHYAQDDLPFGGVGASGMGAYHGIEGFRALSHAKGVLEAGRWNGGVFLRPPFRRIANFVLRMMLGAITPGPREREAPVGTR